MATLAQRIADLAGAVRDKLNLMNAALRPAAIIIVIDGGGAAITSGIKCDVEIPFACALQEWTILADQAGSIQIDLWKTSFANAPPNNGNSITASAKPAISAVLKGRSAILTGWTAALDAGDVLRINVDSSTTVQRVTLSLKVQRT